MNKLRIVIVGGSTGIGFKVAQIALQAGRQVVVASSNADNATAAAAQLGKATQGECVDIGDENSIASFFAHIVAFDHLVATPGRCCVH